MALDGVEYCLDIIGFNDAEERNRIMDDGLGEFSDFKTATESDISDMAEAFASAQMPMGR